MPIHSTIHQGIVTIVAFQHFIAMNTQTRMKKIFRKTNIATTQTKTQKTPTLRVSPTGRRGRT